MQKASKYHPIHYGEAASLRGLWIDMVEWLIGLGRPRAKTPHSVGPVQAEVLRVIRDIPKSAHGAGIADHMRRTFDKEISDAQIYVALRRLETRRLIAERTTISEFSNTPSFNRRGRPWKMYSLTTSGRRALEPTAASEPAETGVSMSGKLNGAKKKELASLVGFGAAVRGDVAC